MMAVIAGSSSAITTRRSTAPFAASPGRRAGVRATRREARTRSSETRYGRRITSPAFDWMIGHLNSSSSDPIAINGCAFSASCSALFQAVARIASLRLSSEQQHSASLGAQEMPNGRQSLASAIHAG